MKLTSGAINYKIVSCSSPQLPFSIDNIISKSPSSYFQTDRPVAEFFFVVQFPPRTIIENIEIGNHGTPRIEIVLFNQDERTMIEKDRFVAVPKTMLLDLHQFNSSISEKTSIFDLKKRSLMPSTPFLYAKITLLNPHHDEHPKQLGLTYLVMFSKMEQQTPKSPATSGFTSTKIISFENKILGEKKEISDPMLKSMLEKDLGVSFQNKFEKTGSNRKDMFLPSKDGSSKQLAYTPRDNGFGKKNDQTSMNSKKKTEESDLFNFSDSEGPFVHNSKENSGDKTVSKTRFGLASSHQKNGATNKGTNKDDDELALQLKEEEEMLKAIELSKLTFDKDLKRRETLELEQDGIQFTEKEPWVPEYQDMRGRYKGLVDYRKEMAEYEWGKDISSKMEEEEEVTINEDSMFSLMEDDISQSFFLLDKMERARRGEQVDFNKL